MRHPPPKLAVDEIRQASEQQSEGRAGRDQITQSPHAEATSMGEDEERQPHADQTAVEGHAAMPDLKDFRGRAPDHSRLIEKT